MPVKTVKTTSRCSSWRPGSTRTGRSTGRARRARRAETTNAPCSQGLRLLAALTRVYRDPDAIGVDTLPEVLVDPERLPATWGSLTVLEPVGKGGFAKVYRARDALKRDVALKLFPVTPENAAALSSRVLREGSLLAKINHRNVVVVHGVEQSNGFVGLWMEFIHGRTMEDELRTRGPLGAEEATLIGVDLCRALAAVHGRGLVHRDIKAQNVMREEGGRTVLMDFGAGTELTAGLHGLLDMAGTPLYLAPELFGGRPATRASDIYSLGVLLYRMVTREFPVAGADRTEIDRAHREGRVKRLRDARPDLPTSFIQTVERALSPNPAERPQTAGELEAALTERKQDPTKAVAMAADCRSARADRGARAMVPVEQSSNARQQPATDNDRSGARVRHAVSCRRQALLHRQSGAAAVTQRRRNSNHGPVRRLPPATSSPCASRRRPKSMSTSSMRTIRARPSVCIHCRKMG